MRRGAVVLLGILTLGASGCIDATRVNNECRWTDSRNGPLNLTNAADRDHLRMDEKIADELGLRLADLRYRNVPTMAAPIRRRCTDALFDSIVVRHGVTMPQIRAAAFYRVWWADILAVFLPAFIVIGVAMDLVTRRVCRAFGTDDRAMAHVSMVFLTPLVALLGLGVTQFWAMGVEAWFLRNGHVSGRAFETPAVAHGWITYVVALVLCVAIGTRRYLRTPLTGGRTRLSWAK
jgi:hypothetical protein